jgi:GNAT superfamily N-acetyltransferase
MSTRAPQDPGRLATRDDLRRLVWILTLLWLAMAALITLTQRYLGWGLAVGLVGGAGALFTVGLLLVAAGSIAASSIEAARRAGASRAQYELRTPRSDAEWDAYHRIRRTVLFERRGLVGVYDASHPDETRPGNYPWLLLYKHEPVGTVRVDVSGSEAIFRRVAVREDVQGRGHGRAMLVLAESFAKEHGASRIGANVDPDAVGFYERCGFSRKRSDDGDGKTVLMRKDLAPGARG